mmetsp:Transcript_2275/g.3595  ORF Transcript_2275/g.3595 Transcript_2275/m.3595 type:complete len:235 (+) Transcript_2275:405-1109(+)
MMYPSSPLCALRRASSTLLNCTTPLFLFMTCTTPVVLLLSNERTGKHKRLWVRSPVFLSIDISNPTSAYALETLMPIPLEYTAPANPVVADRRWFWALNPEAALNPTADTASRSSVALWYWNTTARSACSWSATASRVRYRPVVTSWWCDMARGAASNFPARPRFLGQELVIAALTSSRGVAGLAVRAWLSPTLAGLSRAAATSNFLLAAMSAAEIVLHCSSMESMRSEISADH